MYKGVSILVTVIFFSTTLVVLAKDSSFSKVFVEKGNIYHSPDGKKKIQLTKNGKNSSPVLSPDGKKVVFIRKSDKDAYLAVGDPEDYLQSGPYGILADQIWIIGIDGKNERMLVEDKFPDDRKWDATKIVAHIDDETLQFSTNSRRVYFITSAWVTSGAVHSVNIDGSGHKYLTSGNSLKVIDKGQYKDYLIVRQHRYFVAGGSYDWLWLCKPDGTEEGPLGIDLNEDQLRFLYSDK